VTKKLRRLFPQLVGGQYRLASKRTKRYNCLAWAAGRNDVWWDEPPDGVWPHGVNDGTVEAAIRLYEHLGFRRTGSRIPKGPEENVIRIAICADGSGYTHAARQLRDGRWTSKLGKLQDIEHDSLQSLEKAGTVEAYGEVVEIMEKRPEQLTLFPAQPGQPGQPG
jgi:hypothetical protein